MITAEITHEIPIDELVDFLHKRGKLENSALTNSEWVVLKPKISDGYLRIKVLYGYDSDPETWYDIKDIKTNWEKE